MTTVAALVLAALSQQTTYDTVFDQIKNLAPLPSVAVVRGVVLRRDVMALKLDSGFAYLLTPAGDRTVGIAYVGTGSMSFVPPLLIEQYNLKRVLGDSSIHDSIKAAVFIFTDSTADELRKKLTFNRSAERGAWFGQASDAVHDALEYLVDGRNHLVDGSLMVSLLNHTTNAYFSAYIKRAHRESVMFRFDPLVAEEVLLYRRGHMLDQRTETVCQFQRAEDLARNVSVADEQPDPLAVDQYDIESTIDKNYHYSGRSTTRLIGRRGQQLWAQFFLYNELKIDSLTTAAGVPLTYYRRDHLPGLWIRFAKPMGPSDTVGVRVVYHGDLIGFGSAMDEFLPPWWDPLRRVITPVMDDWAFVKSLHDWFPRYSDQSTPVSLTFHTPSDLKLATIGRLVDSSTSEKVRTTRWVTEQPTDLVSFNIGKFDELDIRDPRIPPVTVQINTEAHRAIRRLIPQMSDPERQVGADVANSLAFFSRVFGPPLFHQYYATEIPYFGDGYAFPGMIQLSWWTFMGLSSSGDEESFRSHEMAHQWWGIGVEPAGYRDRWLAEGFAEFSSLWYMQMILQDNNKYFKKLRDSRNEIRDARAKAVPIGLGTRAGESWHGNYDLTTYRKGAWVLHMLRNMMLDARTMGEERFMAMMHDFYDTYRGKRATTLDFQRVVERHMGQPMDWFFDEWVYGTDVPTYTFAWKADRDSTGAGTGYTAHLRVRQTDVPSNFGMYVPLLIKFDRGETLIRMLVRGPSTEAVVRLPAEPKTVQLNPLESVLAEVKTEGW
ncbi:MAG: hypothetical protein DMD72_12225 [Gemmatimonadetes bacterium]|nr:MAG: hypothetical protein DMD72_12225 [Gemmatimonadota bacterium]